MKHSEIIALARGLLDDTKIPYNWESWEVLSYYNKAINDVCRGTKCLRDSSTASLCTMYLLSGVHSYALDEKILHIASAILSAGTYPLIRTSEDYLDRRVYSWRNIRGTPSRYIPEIEHLKLRVWPYYDDTGVVIGSSNISFVALTKKITKASGLSVFAIGDKINVAGTTSNNGYFTLTAVSDTELTVTETLVNENNTSAALRKVRETASLSIARLPMAPVTDQDLDSEPPFKEMYHIDLIDGILGYAYLKQDTETYDPKKAAKHTMRFNDSINKMKKDYIDLTHVDEVVGPHPGTI